MYCGHEYSLQNLAYGHHVEPESTVIQDKIAWCTEMREKDPPEPTVPSTIGMAKTLSVFRKLPTTVMLFWAFVSGEEKQINPFMRVTEEPVQKHAGKTDPIETMTALRTEKDTFKAKQK